MKILKKIGALAISAVLVMSFVSCANDDGGSGNGGGGDAGYNKPVLPQSVGTNELVGRKIKQVYDEKEYKEYVFSENTIEYINTRDSASGYECIYTYNSDKKEFYMCVNKYEGKTYSEWCESANDNVRAQLKKVYDLNKEKYDDRYKVTDFEGYLKAYLQVNGYKSFDECVEVGKINVKKQFFEGSSFYRYTIGDDDIVEKLEEFCDLSKQDWKNLYFKYEDDNGMQLYNSYGMKYYYNKDLGYESTEITDTKITFKVSEKYKDDKDAIKEPFSFDYVVNKNENTITIKDVPQKDGTKKDCVLTFKGSTITNGASK